jgi:hypothetical protein
MAHERGGTLLFFLGRITHYNEKYDVITKRTTFRFLRRVFLRIFVLFIYSYIFVYKYIYIRVDRNVNGTIIICI